MLYTLLFQSCLHPGLRLISTISILNTCYQSSAKVFSVIPWLEEVHSLVDYASQWPVGLDEIQTDVPCPEASDSTGLCWAWEYAFLSSQVILTLLVGEPHFENYCSSRFLRMGLWAQNLPKFSHALNCFSIASIWRTARQNTFDSHPLSLSFLKMLFHSCLDI